MKVFQLFDDPYSQIANPYIATLMEGVRSLSKDVSFGYGKSVFMSDDIFGYDIIPIHWPDVFFNASSTKEDYQTFRLRLETLKNKGVKFIATCHNLEPHNCASVYEKLSHDLVYGMADVIIHLGQYSYSLFENQYPNIRHVILPHHTYDNLYSPVSKELSLRMLNLDPNRKYILCFGAFRNDEERFMVDSLAAKYHSKGIDVLAPHYYVMGKSLNLYKIGKAWLLCRIKEKLTKGLHIYGWHVSDKMLPYFYGASDVCLIQRNRILNSGNLPMGFYMGKVVVGPDIGNVGQILKDCNNPVFTPNSIDSLFEAVSSALTMNEQCLGNKNAIFARDNLATSVIAGKLLNVYKELVK